MANNVGNLFTKYSATYSKAGDDDADREPLNPKELKKASRNELRGLGNALRVSKRGGNFLDRVVCWLEDRVFSLTRSSYPESSRQKQSQEFAGYVSAALLEIGEDAEKVDEHELIKQIESVRKRDLPLRSGFVQSILQDVAVLQRDAGWGELPEIAKAVFLETDTDSPAQDPVYQEDLLERDSEPEQMVTNTSDNSHDKSGHQTPVHGDESVRNDPSLPSSEMEVETHKNDEKKFADLTGAEFTDRLCSQTRRLVVGYLDIELKRRQCDINPEQSTQVVKDATLELAKRKFPGEEGHDPISDIMAHTKELEKNKFYENVNESFAKPVAASEDEALVETALELFVDNEAWLEAYISTRLDELGIGVSPVDDPNSSPKVSQLKAFREKLDTQEIKKRIHSAASEVLGEAGYNTDILLIDKESPVRRVYQDNLYGDAWSRHKTAATQLFSNNYKAARMGGDVLLLDKVEEDTIQAFIVQFKIDFVKGMPSP